MNYKKIVLIFCIFTVFCGVFLLKPSNAKAITAEEIQAQIDALLKQIAVLQAQLAQMQGTTAWCHDFHLNLKFGMGGTEVEALQKALQKEGFYKSTTVRDTFTFDEYTASAVVGFQEKYASEILTPWGLEHGTGYVGTTTRAKLNALYGCKTECEKKGGNCIYFLNECPAGYESSTYNCLTRSDKCCIPKPIEKSITVLSPNGGEKLVKGNTYGITWTSKGIDEVTIFLADFREKTATAGPTWHRISPNLSAESKIYYWKVAECYGSICDFTAGNEYKIMVSESASSPSYPLLTDDESDNYFSISASTGQPDLTVDDIYYDGSYYIKVKYCNKGTGVGSGDFLIKLRNEATGQEYPGNSYYRFKVPVAGFCDVTGGFTCGLIGVSCGSYAKVSAIIDWENRVVESNENNNQLVKVIGEQAPSITVLSPNGGEEWVRGNSYTIRWASQGLDKDAYLDIYLVDDQGGAACTLSGMCCTNCTNWGKIATQIPVSSGKYSWTIPLAQKAGNRYRIMLRTKNEDCFTGCSIDNSDNYFSIVEKPSITVLSPNGGETWTKGTTQTIKWQDNTPIPLCPAGATCVPPAPKYYDIKLLPYYPPCTGTGEVCPGLYIAPYTIAKSVYGSSYNWLVGKVLDTYGTGDTAPDGSYTIQICQTGSTTCDSSDSYFKIVVLTPSITVISPNGGEQWVIGKSYDITWESKGVDKINIYLRDYYSGIPGMIVECAACPPPGFCCRPCNATLIAENIFASLGKYSWTIPTSQTPTPTAKIVIQQSVWYNGCLTDYSDNYFSIVECKKEGESIPVIPNAPSCCQGLTLIKPKDPGIVGIMGICTAKCGNGVCDTQTETNYNCSTDCKIVTCADSDGGIDYFTKGTVYTEGPTTLGGLTTGTYYDLCWNNGPVLHEWYCGTDKTVYKKEYTCPNGCKDGACVPQTSSITVLSPNGGERWITGTTHTIKWSAQNVSRVVIDVLDRNGKVVDAQIPAVLANTGSYSWAIPYSIPTSTLGDSFKVRISNCPTTLSELDCANLDLSSYGYDLSDDYFSIPAQPCIVVLSPKGGEQWIKGNTYDIKMEFNARTESAVTEVGIRLKDESTWKEYSIGKTFLRAPTTIYSWTVPADIPAGNYYKIQVSSTEFGVSSGASDYFSIVATSVTCADSDGGKNYYTKGTTIWGPISGQYQKATDGCDLAGKTLSEFYCYYFENLKGYYSTVTYYTCAYGCKDGACNAPPTPSPSPTTSPSPSPSPTVSPSPSPSPSPSASPSPSPSVSPTASPSAVLQAEYSDISNYLAAISNTLSKIMGWLQEELTGR